MSSDFHTGPRAHHLGGIAAMLAATSLFASMDAMVKLLMAEHSVIQVLFFRAAFGLIPLAPLLWQSGMRAVATARPWAHAVRSAIGLLAVGCFFLAFARLPLVQVTAIGFAAPLLITALSVPLLQERVPLQRWLAVAAGFGGILIVAGPDAWAGELPGAGAVFAVAGTVLYALVMVLMRAMGRTEAAVTTVFWFSVLTMLLTGAALPWAWRTPDAGEWVLFAAVGILGGTGQLLIARAVRLAPASVVAPFDYFHIVVSSSLGWLVFAEIPTANTLAGAMVVMASGLYVLRNERKPTPLQPP
ncbi:DMT family permease [Paramagnetospirillum caucaseum]|uniref:DMT family permease n=1 Tax=Paramagnetospirillum caucaseum TaxID=1244869 RepID=M3A9B9_9PROT|nr:DMT family transporter [Paramagnetospirillum caucaseum]EME69383.1 DMT family permease [Paramagnetospirillum caucaseum]